MSREREQLRLQAQRRKLITLRIISERIHKLMFSLFSAEFQHVACFLGIIYTR